MMLAMPVSFSPGFLLEKLAEAALCWLLVALAVLDAEHLWLPDFLTWPGIAAGLLLRVFVAAVSYQGRPGWALLIGIGGAAAAAALILLIRWTYWLVKKREGIGLGDAKLMAMLAAWLGLPGALLAFVLGVALGAAVAIGMLLVPKARRGAWGSMKLPLGTFLCVGGIVSAFWGQPLIAAYLRLVGF
jgi:leader peptidase (prepilin peptidase)/N-methyltransferase